ncbi:hypothetical protein KUCAC02_018674 [Chaenocephalus aceratus]|uniref:Uncharacterized protein n=1 Tax=Chaenocephalus aceratus TaxID=36190 RepID=A0ACB9WAK6_CHAAC|nr:hypothetical protein KUCAC02_018674 [Chaenocephalus aceratus]
MPMHAQLSTSAKTCLDNVEAIYKLMVAGWTRLNPDQEEHPDTPTPPQDPPNQLPDGSYILNLVPCDPSPITHNQQPQETADPPPNQAPSTHPPPNQPTHTTPGSEHPPTTTPGSEHPPTTKPGSQHPPTTTPGSQHPPTTTPGSQYPPTTTPGSQHPPTTKPGSQHPPTTKPGSQHPPTTTPGSQHPPTTTPGSQHPPTTKPGSQHPPTITPGSNYAGTITPNPTMRQPRKRTKTMKDCSHNHLEVFPVRNIIKTRNRKMYTVFVCLPQGGRSTFMTGSPAPFGGIC